MLLGAGLVPWLHRRGAHDLAAITFLVTALGSILTLVLVVAPHSGHLNFLLPLAILPWLVASSHSLVVALAISSVSAAAYATIVYYFDVGYDLRESARYLGGFAIANMAIIALLFMVISYFSRSLVVAAELGLEQERQQSERLVFEVLPASIAERVSGGEAQIAERFGDASVLFCSLDGFSRLAAGVGAEDLVGILDDLFGSFDDLCERHGVEKIKSMAAAGVPVPRTDHAEVLATLALDMDLAGLRVGLHSLGHVDRVPPEVVSRRRCCSRPTTWRCTRRWRWH